MTEPYVEIEKVAEHYKVSLSTIRAWIRNGQIPQDGCYIKIGKTYRFKLSEVDRSVARLNSATALGISATDTGISATDKGDGTDIDSSVENIIADLDEDL